MYVRGKRWLTPSEYNAYLFIFPTRRAIIKWLTASQPHGMLSPPRISRSCPHCLRRFFHARTVAGQKYLPILVHRHIESCSTLAAEGSRSYLSVVLAQPLFRLSVTGRMGKVFDDRLFGFQSPVRGIASPRWISVLWCRSPGRTPSLTSQQKGQKLRTSQKLFYIFLNPGNLI